MLQKSIPMLSRKRIALIAHDNKKQDILEWAKYNKEILRYHDLFATGTTGSLIAEEIGLEITKFHSGPLGGDQQVGAAITQGEINFLIFFGIHWRRIRMIPTSKRCCALRWCGTFPSRAIAPPRIL